MVNRSLVGGKSHPAPPTSWKNWEGTWERGQQEPWCPRPSCWGGQSSLMECSERLNSLYPILCHCIDPNKRYGVAFTWINSNMSQYRELLINQPKPFKVGFSDLYSQYLWSCTKKESCDRDHSTPGLIIRLRDEKVNLDFLRLDESCLGKSHTPAPSANNIPFNHIFQLTCSGISVWVRLPFFQGRRRNVNNLHFRLIHLLI